ncbi:MAG: hypothetical protein AAFW47_00215 [Pseudomonadota bacterium]
MRSSLSRLLRMAVVGGALLFAYDGFANNGRWSKAVIKAAGLELTFRSLST